MNMTVRDRCAVTGAHDLEPLFTFKAAPVFMGCTDQPESSDLKADMEWVISRSSGLIQLRSLLPLDVLYPEPHGAGSVGPLWHRHHQAFADFLRRFSLTSVFEIGGSHGILAADYDSTGNFPWTILEPNPTPVAGCKAKFITGFFDRDFKFSGPFDAVVHSHVFEHIYAPDEFMAQLAEFMAEGKLLIFSVPNIRVMVERRYTNSLNFEHTTYLTEPYIEYLLARHGFRLTGRENFTEDHSIFYSAVRDRSVKPVDLPSGLYEANKKAFREYLDYYSALSADLNARKLAAGRPVYLFGAHIFSLALISFGLDTSGIVCLLDNDPDKQGRRLYGTGLRVKSPKALKDAHRPIVILKAGVYSREIKADILGNINADTEFWE